VLFFKQSAKINNRRTSHKWLYGAWSFYDLFLRL